MMFATVKPNFQKSTILFPELNHLVNHVFSEAPQHKGFRPVANITEKENAYEIELAAPGFEKENFSIKVEKEILTVSAIKEAQSMEGEKIIRKEFNFSQFERTFHLSEKVNAEHIAANYINGILTISLAKREEVKPSVHTVAVS